MPQQTPPQPPSHTRFWLCLWSISLLLLWLAACPASPLPGNEPAPPGDSGHTIEQKPDTSDASTEDTQEPHHESDASTETPATQEPPPKPTEPRSEPQPDAAQEGQPEPFPEITNEQLPDALPFFSCSPTDITDLYKLRQWVFGKKNYIQYIPGNAPLILTAPHGGDLQAKQDFPDILWPAPAPNGQIVPSRDGNSLEKTLEVAHEFYKMTGLTPHIIINHVVRGRLQLNSDKAPATRGPYNSQTKSYPYPKNQVAEDAWEEFHRYIRAAKTWVTNHCKRGLLLDMHTNGRRGTAGASPNPNGPPYFRNELGYILTTARLKEPTTVLETRAGSSSIKALAALPWNGSLVDILRGPMSLGTMLQQAGYDTIPSTKYPHSTDGKYYTGGFNIREHGSQKGGVIDAIQLESNFSFMNSTSRRAAYSKSLASFLIQFFKRYYRFQFTTKGTTPQHSRCSTPKLLQLTSGKVALSDSSWGASNEFGDKITCGLQSIQMEGPQLYYKLRLQKGKTYNITITADFYVRIYLFQGACSPASISASCQRTGVNGSPYGYHNVPLTKSYTASATGDYILAVDSRKASWFGTYRLAIEEAP